MLHNCPSVDSWHAGIPRSARLSTIAGIAILLVWGVGFGVWATTAPLDGAVVAGGSFVATGQNKQVQHFEGGIVREIAIKEGDLVEPGQLLVRLDETSAKAKLRRLVLRKYRLLAMQARLHAESRSLDDIQLPPELRDRRDEPEIRDLVMRQVIELQARRTRTSNEIEVLRKEIAGLAESIEGYQAQVAATRVQMGFFKEELSDKHELMKRALVRKSDVLAVQRAESRLSGELGQLLSRIADSRERIARANQQIAQILSTAVQKAVEELRLTETEIDDISEQIRAATDVVDRLDVRAPVRGVIVKLNHHTGGGVIAPGASILELLPVNEELIIESRVAPSEITHLAEGQDALVRLTALNHRLVPMVAAKVIYVSADAVSDHDPRRAAAGMMANGSGFVIRARLDEADLRAKAHDFRPVPGMPADIFVKTGQRTFFQYLMQPLIDSFSRAFRES